MEASGASTVLVGRDFSKNDWKHFDFSDWRLNHWLTELGFRPCSTPQHENVTKTMYVLLIVLCAYMHSTIKLQSKIFAYYDLELAYSSYSST